MKKTFIGRIAKSAVSFAVAIATVLTMALCFPFNTLDTEAAKRITQADIDAARDKIKANEKKIKEYQAKLESIGQDLDNALDAKEQLDHQIELIQTNVDETETLIEKYAKLISDKEQLIADRENQISKKYADFLDRLRISYEDGTQNYLELLISSDSLFDFITRIDNLGSVLSYEQKMMTELEKEVSDLTELKESLSVKKNEYVELEKFQSQSKAELDSKLKEAEQLIARLQKDEAAARRAEEKAAANDAALDAELKDLLKKYEDQQKQDQEAAFLWPLDSNRRSVTSLYGWRVLNGKKGFHTGADIGLPYGCNIYAAKAGTVRKAEYNKSYGYYVLIDHGGGQSTLYAHSSKLLVVVGQKVERGQVIAKVGSTGNSTGNHLHFEIRINGATRDPLVKGWLVIENNGKMVDPIANNLLKYYC